MKWFLLVLLFLFVGCRSAGTIQITVTGGTGTTIEIQQTSDQMAGKQTDIPIDATVPVQ